MSLADLPLFDAMLRAQADPRRAARYRPFALDLEPERHRSLAPASIADGPHRAALGIAPGRPLAVVDRIVGLLRRRPALGAAGDAAPACC
jgi:hypothetical protein